MTAWRPLLDGEDAAHARSVLDQIAEALAARPIALESGKWTLARGEPGIGLCFAYLATATGEARFAEQAEARLAAAVEYAADAADAPWLWTGLAGPVWAVEQALALEPNPADADDDPHDQVDDVLLDVVDAPSAAVPFELMNGIAGLGVYALERFRSPSARTLLERVVTRLCELAVPREPGMTWFCSRESILASERELHPDGYHPLGVAHGLLGPVAVLAAAARAGVGGERARSTADAALRYLFAQQLSEPGRGRFAYAAEVRQPHFAGWCYGDAGAAAIVACAGDAIDTRWVDTARGLALDIADRQPAACGLGDVSLCHGAFGLAHMLNRLAWQLDDEQLADAARSWFRRGLASHEPGRGIGGFTITDQDGLPLAGLLDGSAGIALALLAATTSLSPDWDRAFALSGY